MAACPNVITIEAPLGVLSQSTNLLMQSHFRLRTTAVGSVKSLEKIIGLMTSLLEEFEILQAVVASLVAASSPTLRVGLPHFIC